MLDPDERQPERDRLVPHGVVRRRTRRRRPRRSRRASSARSPSRPGRGPSSRSASWSAASSVSTTSWPGALGEARQRRGAQQPPGIDRDEPAGDPLDLPEEVARDDDGDPEVAPDALDQAEHLVAAGRVEPVRRLVEEEEARIVDERLGELDALLHAGRVATDRPIALLVQTDVAQDVGGPLTRRAGGQAGDAGHVADELGGADVRRKAVVLGHVADELADPGTIGRRVEIEDGGLALGRLEQAEEDLDQRALAGAVGADEADHALADLDAQRVERGDAAGIALRQRPGADEGHALAVYPGALHAAAGSRGRGSARGPRRSRACSPSRRSGSVCPSCSLVRPCGAWRSRG